MGSCTVSPDILASDAGGIHDCFIAKVSLGDGVRTGTGNGLADTERAGIAAIAAQVRQLVVRYVGTDNGDITGVDGLNSIDDSFAGVGRLITVFILDARRFIQGDGYFRV